MGSFHSRRLIDRSSMIVVLCRGIVPDTNELQFFLVNFGSLTFAVINSAKSNTHSGLIINVEQIFTCLFGCIKEIYVYIYIHMSF